MKGSDSFFNGYNSAGSRDVKVVKSVSTSTSHSLPKTSEPNSVEIVYKNGKKTTERYYDGKGKAYLDIDYTDHGNPKMHPKVPHQHKIVWKDGKFHRETKGQEINK